MDRAGTGGDNAAHARAPFAARCMTARALTAAVVSIAAAGAVVSSFLVSAHASGGAEALGALCGPGGGCDRVLASPWATFPPGGGVPVASLGLAYFVAIGTWTALGGQTATPWGRRATLAVASIAGLFSAYFIWVMAARVGAFCPLCLATHAASFGVLACLFPGRQVAATTAAPRLVTASAVAALAAAAAAFAGADSVLRAGENERLGA